MPRSIDEQYVDCLKRILRRGEERVDRTGNGTLAVFGHRFELDLREDFPLVGFKLTRWEKAFIEMLWFIRGDDDLAFLHEHDCHIWDDWADEHGKLGPIYGVQWRKWSDTKVNVGEGGVTYETTYIDQLSELINKLNNKPTDRRLLVSAWNVGDIPQMGLPPCHRSFQCYVSNKKELDLQLDIRSSDTGLGLPFNIAQYAMLTHLLARTANLIPRKLIVNTGDTHIYLNHVDPLTKWIDEHDFVDCEVKLQVQTTNTSIDGYCIDDFSVTGYQSNPFLKLPIAV